MGASCSGVMTRNSTRMLWKRWWGNAPLMRYCVRLNSSLRKLGNGERQAVHSVHGALSHVPRAAESKIPRVSYGAGPGGSRQLAVGFGIGVLSHVHHGQTRRDTYGNAAGSLRRHSKQVVGSNEGRTKVLRQRRRAKRLAKRLNAHDDATDFQAKMIATLLQLKEDRHSMQDIWLSYLRNIRRVTIPVSP